MVKKSAKSMIVRCSNCISEVIMIKIPVNADQKRFMWLAPPKGGKSFLPFLKEEDLKDSCVNINWEEAFVCIDCHKVWRLPNRWRVI